MVFPTKKEIEDWASAHDVDLSGLTWQQKVKVVTEARGQAGEEPSPPHAGKKWDYAQNAWVQGKAHVIGRQQQNIDKPIICTPELRMVSEQYFGFDEVLGDQPLNVVDNHFGEMVAMLTAGGLPKGIDEMSTTNKRVGKSGKKTVGTTGMPKGNAQIYFEPDAPGAVFSAKFLSADGYIWSNGSPLIYKISEEQAIKFKKVGYTIISENNEHFIVIPVRGVKDCLLEMGQYENYLEECQRARRYAHNIPIIDKSFTKNLFRKIEEDLAKKKKLYG